MQSAQADETTFGHVDAPGSRFEKSVYRFTEMAIEKLEGEAGVMPYGSSQLGEASRGSRPTIGR